MITAKQGRTLLGSRVFDRDGEMIGRVAEVYTIGTDRPPTWLLIMDDSAPPRTHVAPCDGAELTGTGIHLAVAGRVVETAPALTRPPNEPITEADEARLLHHYTEPGAASTDPGGTGDEGADATAAMTRSEERLRVTTTTEVTGRVRVRRYIETENIQVTVPVRRERISIEHLPPADQENLDALRSPADPNTPHHDAPPAGDLPEEIILHEERVVILKEVVPTERIRLSREVITEMVTIDAPLRRERIELDRPDREKQPLD
jgi:stress response protein YsnF